MARDWRLRGQDSYLKGATLRLRRYMPVADMPQETHCVFCWAKISKNPGDIAEAYGTPTGKHWVCQKCYEDFKESFEFELLK